MSLPVASLALAKGLPVDFLAALGVVNGPRLGVEIPYLAEDGEEMFRRTRGRPGGPRFEQPLGVKLAAYGLNRLADCRREGWLVLVEGESDCWTLWYAGFPALGIPGAGAANTLRGEFLDSCTRLYVWIEPGQSGEQFARGVSERLRDLGYAGGARSLRHPAAKDPSELYLADRAAFAQTFRDLLRAALLLPLPAGGPDPGRNGPTANGHAPAVVPELLDVPLPPAEPWPAPPSAAAYQGVLGDVLARLAPRTEADPVAILVQVLAMFGSVIGRHAHWTVEADKHYGNLFCCLVGDTALGRKGVSFGRALSLFGPVNDSWARERIFSGLSSGEGLIHCVRDPSYGTHQVKQRGRVVDTQTVLVDQGEADKRLMIVETEFARPLLAMERKGNTLSPVLRQAWDTGNLASLTKTAKCRATGAHVSIIGHVTREELHRHLGQTEQSNGFVNRFLWIASRRAELLPLGGGSIDLGALDHKFALAVEHAQLAGEICLDEGAARLWCNEVYPRLADAPPGIQGAILARGPAQIRRLAMLYALLDFDDAVRLPHLLAALALWDYCERSATWIFRAGGTGDANADEILAALRAHGPMSKTQINRQVFFGKLDAPSLSRSLILLRDHGLIREEMAQPNGRPVVQFIANTKKPARSARSEPSTNEHNDLRPNSERAQSAL